MKLRQEAALELAAKVAEQSDHKQHKLGCVLVDKNDNLVSFGFNRYKTHPMQAEYAGHIKPYLHAEISALVRARSSPHKAYIVRKTRSGTIGLAKPCPSCMSALLDAGIDPKNIFWST